MLSEAEFNIHAQTIFQSKKADSELQSYHVTAAIYLISSCSAGHPKHCANIYLYIYIYIYKQYIIHIYIKDSYPEPSTHWTPPLSGNASAYKLK